MICGPCVCVMVSHNNACDEESRLYVFVIRGDCNRYARNYMLHGAMEEGKSEGMVRFQHNTKKHMCGSTVCLQVQWEYFSMSGCNAWAYSDCHKPVVHCFSILPHALNIRLGWGVGRLLWSASIGRTPSYRTRTGTFLYICNSCIVTGQ